MREHGIVLYGPPPATLIDPVSVDDVRAATAGVLRSWWATTEATDYIRTVPLSALAVYVAPTMCRALYSLEHGQVISKPAACQWALATQEARWRPIIERALRGEIDEALREEVVAFVRYVTGAAVGEQSG